MSQLTMEDIEKALKQLNKDKKVVRRYDKEGNWIDIDSNTGRIETIGMGEGTINTFKDLCYYPNFKSIKKKKIIKFWGISIIEQNE